MRGLTVAKAWRILTVLVAQWYADCQEDVDVDGFQYM